MPQITAIRVVSLWETCQRTTYWVELETDEGFTKTPDCHRTGSVYTNFEGLSKEEARERALIDAHQWSDFLGIPVEPYVEDGVIHEPAMKLEPYTTRRILDERRRAKQAPPATLPEGSTP